MLQEKKQDEIVIRGYREADHDQVQRVCLGTGTDPTFAQPQMQQLLLNAFCNYYIEQEPENCFVADDGNGVVGYILCARDAGVWKENFPGCYAPGWEDGPLKMFYEGVMASPLKYAGEYPAHLHIDILPEYQRVGVGSRLMDALLDHLRQLHIPGVMLGVASDNEKGKNFYRKYGFSVLEEGPQEIVMGMKL